ncbi:TonB-dependent receptor plug domain-containing protein [Xylophilus sp.]|uniref:TonB-dependent receptor plug domain-containing protein n=1 Tax=Xylophilus sp. TaxID=2653893 RepID=UPI0013B81F83|nr:TonB-dependent receptor [Xylophilus sp.]KAF1045897.1 MAG: Colicin I receptor [Xylophilus sp.]
MKHPIRSTPVARAVAALRPAAPLAARGLAGVGLLLASQGLLAQTTEASAPATAVLDEVIVVTGNRGDAKSVTESLNPISVVSEQELARTGKQNLRDALSALEPSYGNVPQFKGQQGLAVNTASLRGLSGNHVLVLVNGKRRHASAVVISGIGGTGTDLDLIPVSAVKRIEVLRDGASAQYGSDALAGVINIILKDADEGGSASITYGQYGSGAHVGGLGHYGRTGTLQINKGLKLGEDGGFLNLSADLLLQQDTNIAGPVPTSTLLYPSGDARESTANRYRQIMGQPNVNAKNVAYNLELPLPQGRTLYSFGTFSHRDSYGFGTYRTPAASQNLIDIYPEGFLPEFGVQDHDYQVAAGVRGNDGGWKWDLSTTLGNDNASIYNNNTLSGSYGSATKRNFYLGAEHYAEWTTNADISREIDTGWFDKPLTVSLGYEHRLSTFKILAGEEQSWNYGGVVPSTGQWAGQPITAGSAGMAGLSPEAAGSWRRTTDAAYIDLTQAVTQDWTLSTAARFEHYDDVGNVPSGKVSTRYKVSPTLAVRGSLSNGFAAPSLQNTYYTNISAGWNRDTNTGEWVQGRGGLRPASNEYSRALGATDLRPEKSRDLSLGFVWTPAKGTNVTVDAYQIDIRDRIVQSTTLNYSTPAVNAILAAAGLDSQNVSYFTNAGDTVTRGLDLVVDHTQNLGGLGAIKWVFTDSVLSTKIKKLNNPAVLTAAGISLVGRDVVSKLTEAQPKNRFTISGNWVYNDWDVLLKVRHYGKSVTRNATAADRDEYNPAATLVDTTVGYWINDKTKLSIGVNNLFDHRPNQLTDAAVKYFGFPVDRPNYTWTAPYDNNGRYVFARLDVSF